MDKIVTLYKKVDDQELKIIGHFTLAEVKALLADGYRKNSRQQVNKNGIRVVA